MATIKAIREEPPDGWKYLEPATGIWIAGDFFAELVERVCAHRAYKGVEPSDAASVSLIVQRQICSVAPPGVCRPEPGETYQPYKDKARSFSPDTVMSASSAGLAWLKAGGAMVPKKESEARAATCRGCRLNRPSPSWVCTVLCKTLDSLVPEGRREPGISLCGICSCSLAAKVTAPMSVIEASNAGRNLEFPDWCWQKPKA